MEPSLIHGVVRPWGGKLSPCSPRARGVAIDRWDLVDKNVGHDNFYFMEERLVTKIARGAIVAVAMVALLPMGGCLYANVKTPLDTNLESTDLGTKVGKSEAKAILGLVAWGDAGTQAAAKDGGITTIKHADQESFSVLGFVYARYRTVVYGD